MLSPAIDRSTGRALGLGVMVSFLRPWARRDAHGARHVAAANPALGSGLVQLALTVTNSQTLQIRFRLVSARAWRAS
jgi:hypothetical protein